MTHADKTPAKNAIPPPNGAPALYVDLLGRAQWRLPGGAAVPLSAKDAALFALLAVEGTMARDVLADWLWPGAHRKGAGDNLRQRIARLRKHTGAAIFVTGAVVRLKADVAVDLTAVPEQPAEALLHAGDLLAGTAFEGDALDAWVRGQRERLRRERAERLAGAAQALEARGELAAALRLAEAVVALTPLLEHGWRRLMRLHHLRGDRLAAIDAFERLETLLRDETGGRPDPETVQLLQMVESASGVSPHAARLLPAALKRPPRLIGRDPEWRGMANAWDLGQPVLLLGDAGLGKTRLLDDFCARRGGVLGERGRPGDAAAPYAVLARLLVQARSVFALDPDAGTRQELARIAPEFGPAPTVPAQQLALWRAVELVLTAAVAAGLTALIVDDLHFADAASIDILRWLSGSRALAGVGLAFAARPLDDSAVGTLLRDWLDDSQRPLAIELKPLSQQHVGVLLASLDLPTDMAPTDGAAQLYRRAGGHPLFTLETLRQSFLNGGDTGPDGSAGPTQVTMLLERRLRQLPADALDLMRVAAVAGVDLTLERAARLLGRGVLALADPLVALERANVLVEQRFAHDLVQEAALRLVPAALATTLHADLAALLAADPRVPPGRTATHWEAAARWAEAGACWHAAGLAARLAGRLVEQHELLERAADCHRRAGNAAGEFDALRADLDGLLFRHGSAAVLAALPRLRALAIDGERLLRCRLAEAESLIDLGRGDEAIAVSRQAVDDAAAHPRWLGDAWCLHGMALSLAQRWSEAIDASRQAGRAARHGGDTAQKLRVTRSLAYVLYSAGRVGEAVPAQRAALRLAEALGDSAEATAAEGSLAALMIVVGDMPAAHAHASAAQRHYAVMGVSDNSSLGCANLIALGQAAAALGRFGEALDALREAERVAGVDAALVFQARARIQLAKLWLTLGNADAARELVSGLPADTMTGMQMQAHWLVALAEAMQGKENGLALEQLGLLGRAQPGLPIVKAAWFEWSYQGNAAEVVARLRDVRAQCERLGMPGAARSLAVREVARLAELDASVHAAELAATLMPFVATGLSARSYPPEAWLTLAKAFESARQAEAARDARTAAVAWIRDVALPNVPAEHRDGFLNGNPVNRALLSAVTR